MNENVVYIETSQTSLFKILIDSLKDVLRDTNIKIYPIDKNDDNKGKIEILSVDKINTILIKINLFAKSFDNFHLDSSYEQYSIGLNMQSFSKLLKNVNDEDNLCLFIKKNDENYLCIDIENKEKNMITKSKLKILDIDDDYIWCWKELSNFPIKLTLWSSQFHKAIKELSNIGDKITISFLFFSDEKLELKDLYSLILETKGDYGEKQIIMWNFSDSQSNKKKIINIVQNTFEIKNFLIFSKCYQLSNDIVLEIKKESPLIIKYKISNLGFIHLYIWPTINYDNNSNNIVSC